MTAISGFAGGLVAACTVLLLLTARTHASGCAEVVQVVELSSPRSLRQFNWIVHGLAYDYILTRGAPAEVEGWLGQRGSPVTRNGSWALFEVRR